MVDSLQEVDFRCGAMVCFGCLAVFKFIAVMHLFASLDHFPFGFDIGHVSLSIESFYDHPLSLTPLSTHLSIS